MLPELFGSPAIDTRDVFGEGRLEFHLEELQVFSADIEKLEAELQNLSEDIRKEMETLKADWKTPAGKEFFEKQDYQWADEVKKYIGVLETLREMIDFACTKYSEVKEAGEKITVNY